MGHRSPRQAELPDRAVRAARQLAMVVIGPAAQFAPTSYARARLIRQLHASGLLAGGPREIVERGGAISRHELAGRYTGRPPELEDGASH